MHAPAPRPLCAWQPRPRNTYAPRRRAADRRQRTACPAAHHGLRRLCRPRISRRLFRIPRFLVQGCAVQERCDARGVARHAEPASADLAQRTRGAAVLCPLQVGRLDLLDVHDARRGRRVRNSDSAGSQQTRPGRNAASRQYAKAHDEVSVVEEQVERVRLAKQHRQNIVSLRQSHSCKPGRRDPRLCAVQDDRALPQQLEELAVRGHVLWQNEPPTRELGKVRRGEIGLEGGAQLLEALHFAQRHAHA